MIPELLEKVAQRTDLTRAEMAHAVEQFLGSDCPDAQIAALLMGIRVKGEAVEELIGAAQALRAHAVKLPLATPPQLDTCGTGGDGQRSLNLSTAAALVAAAAGITVAKHGNRSVSSACGSADLLEALGIPITLSPEALAQRIERDHFGFLFAPHFHPATRAVAGIRRSLGIRTLFNLLGPLTNPAGVRTQLIGVFHPDRAPLMATSALALGIERALIVAAETGLDELSPEGRTLVVTVDRDGQRQAYVSAADFGLEPAPLDSIRGGDRDANAAALRLVLGGAPHPARTGVLMNAAAALVAAGADPDYRTATAHAAALIDEGAVTALLARLAQP